MNKEDIKTIKKEIDITVSESEAVQEYAKIFRDVETISDFLKSKTWDHYCNRFQDFESYFKKNFSDHLNSIKRIHNTACFCRDLVSDEPYVFPILDKQNQSTGAQMTFEDFVGLGYWYKARKQETKDRERQKKLPYKPETYIQPLDPAEEYAFRLTSEKPSKTVPTAKEGDKREVSVYVEIDFEALQETGVDAVSKLTAFDQRVYEACASLIWAGYGSASIEQIYYAMGYSSRSALNEELRKKIRNSIAKMRSLPVTVSNQAETKAGYKYPNFQRNRGTLLPTVEAERSYHGRKFYFIYFLKTEESRFPILLDFAAGRNQLAEVDMKYIETSQRMTETTLKVQHYVRKRILRMRNGSVRSRKIKYEPDKGREQTGLYRNVDAKTWEQKKSARKAVEAYLKECKESGFIKNFRKSTRDGKEDGVIITLPADDEPDSAEA